MATFLDGRDLVTRTGFVAELWTTDADGWPRGAMLSIGEMLATSPHEVRLALWHDSHTTRNVERDGRAVLAFVLDEAAFRVRLDCRPAGAITVAERQSQTGFVASVVDVRRDVVNYAVLETGVWFRPNDAQPMWVAWRATLDALRALPAASST